MIAEKNQYIGSAYRKLQNISQDKQMQLEYEAREKAVRDYNQIMKEAELRGREAEKKIGREMALERAKDMLKDGLLPLDKIAQYSGVFLQEVENL